MITVMEQCPSVTRWNFQQVASTMESTIFLMNLQIRHFNHVTESLRMCPPANFVDWKKNLGNEEIEILKNYDPTDRTILFPDFVLRFLSMYRAQIERDGHGTFNSVHSRVVKDTLIQKFEAHSGKERSELVRMLNLSLDSGQYKAISRNTSLLVAREMLFYARRGYLPRAMSILNDAIAHIISAN
jgi:hypothetical protein